MVEIGSTEAVQIGDEEDEPQIQNNQSGLFGASVSVIRWYDWIIDSIQNWTQH
jgi:hypothetical protein